MYETIFYEFMVLGQTGQTADQKNAAEDEAPVIENLNQFDNYIIAENISEIYNFINKTFDFIESVQNGTYDGHKIRSITLIITYNTQYHYPTRVDLSTGYVESIDGGVYYTLNITEFLELE